MADVCIYSDEGVSSLCLDQTIRTFNAYGYRVTTLKAYEINRINEFDVFVMPGGRDLPYLDKLGLQGVNLLIQFVENGGTYIGFCAGAYFACNRVEFEIGTTLEVCGSRPLDLFHGTGYGTLYPDVQFVYNSEAGSHASLVRQCNSGLKNMEVNISVYVYYNGGCSFKPASSSVKYETLAVYEDVSGKPPAIISFNHGKGKVLLSGVHPEIDYESLKLARAPAQVVTKLESTQAAKHSFFQAILKTVTKAKA